MVRAPVKKSGFGTTFLIWQNKLIRGGLENTGIVMTGHELAWLLKKD